MFRFYPRQTGASLVRPSTRLRKRIATANPDLQTTKMPLVSAFLELRKDGGMTIAQRIAKMGAYAFFAGLRSVETVFAVRQRGGEEMQTAYFR